MALFGGQVQTTPYQAPDYGPSVAAAKELAMTQAQGIAGAVGQVADYFKQQGEKKKLIKKSDVQIDAALKLFPDLAPTLQGYRDQLKDENLPLDDRMAIADSISKVIDLGIGEMRNAQKTLMERQRLGMEAEYKQGMLEASQMRAGASVLSAQQSAKPTFDLQKATITSPDGETFEMDIPYDKKKGMFFDPDAGKYIKDVNKWGFGEPSYVEGEAMPTPTSQNEIIAPSTAYSFGKAVGGPDELQDKWTNKGYTSTGPNLVEGVVAVNTNKYPLGTIFKDSESGKVYVAADRHGNKDSSVIDFFQNPENYTGGKVNKRLSIIGSVPKNKIPKTKEGMSQLIEQYSNVPDYSTSSNASQIDNAISMGGDMTQQAMGTPQQQAEIARMIEEGEGMAMAQNIPQGAMPTEPSMATQQPQLPQQATPKVNLRPGFVPVRPQGQAQFRQATPEEVATYGTQGQVNTATGEFKPIRPPATPRYTKTPQEELESQRLTVLDKEQADLRSAGLNASQDIAQLKGITNLLDTSVKTGFGRETIMRAKRVIGADVANEEQFQSLVGNEAMKNIALTKGAISDREMDYFKNVLSPNMGKTTEGNKKILEFRIRFSERASKIAKTITKMQSQGESPYKIQEQIDNIIASEPLFSPSDANATPQNQAESDANFLEGYQRGE